MQMNRFNFWSQQGWIRTTFFIIFFLIYNSIFRDYVVGQADLFLDDRHWGENPIFGVVLFVIFLLETVALFFAIKHLSYLKYLLVKEGIAEKKGCLVRLNDFFLGIGIYFHIIYVFFLELIIQNSTASILGPITILILLAREGYFIVKLWGIMYEDKIPKKIPKELTSKQLNLVGITLTISSVVFFNISWDVLTLSIGGSGIAAFFLSFILYLPIRIFFILDDYLSLKEQKARRRAILSSFFVIFIAVFYVIIGI